MYFVYHALYDREFQYVLQHPRKLVHPRLGPNVPSLLHAAIFGSIPDEETAHAFALRELGAEAEQVVPDGLLRTLLVAPRAAW